MTHKRRLLSLMLVITLLFFLFSCADSTPSENDPTPNPDDGRPSDSGDKAPTGEEDGEQKPESTQPENYHPLLWKVSDTAGNYIYVFASLSAAGEEIYPLPSAVWTAYYDSVHFLTERDIFTFESLFEKIDDTEAQNTLIAYYKEMMYLDSTIEKHLSKDTYDKSVSLFTENGLTHKLYEYYNPIFWVEKLQEIVVRESGLSSHAGTDYRMSEQAIKDNKFIAMTNIGEREALLSSLSDKLQEMILLPYLEEGALKTKAEQTKAFYKAWIEGDVEQLSALCPTLFEEIPAPPAEGQTPSEAYALYSEYNEKYLTPLTEDMYGQMKGYLDGGYTVFVSLDPTWLLGDNGFLSRFTAEGYIVVPIETAA